MDETWNFGLEAERKVKFREFPRLACARARKVNDHSASITRTWMRVREQKLG